MARIIHTGDTPAKRRRAHARSCAEVLRLLAQRSVIDAETQDMAAFLVFNLRGIYRTIEDSAQVWDDRNYWKKAEHLRHRWRWSLKEADALEALVRAGQWEELTASLAALFPHFSDITVNSITRNADWWCGAYQALIKSSQD